MKKLIYTGKYLTILALIVLSGCKKDSKVAFPTQPSSNGTYPDYVYGTPTMPRINDADGILAAVHVHNYRILTVSPFEKDYQYGMAQFTNTTGNFGSLTNADSVFVNATNCAKSSNLSYISNTTTYSLNFSNPVSWRVKGAGSVPAMTYTVSTNNPVYTLFSSTTKDYWGDTWIPQYPRVLVVVPAYPTAVVPPQPTKADSIRWKKDVITYNSLVATYNAAKLKRKTDSTYNNTPYATIPIKNYVTNADSVFIIFNDGVAFNYQIKVAPTDSLVKFRPNDFSGKPQYNSKDLTLQINLINYSSVSVSGKKYYFIRMGSYIKYWRAN